MCIYTIEKFTYFIFILIINIPYAYSQVTFLQKCQPEFLHDLVLKMKMTIYTPGDYVCRKGEIAREMYVISDGILEVIR